jgi:hypothetical protein
MRMIMARWIMLCCLLGAPVLAGGAVMAQAQGATIIVESQPCAVVAQLQEAPGVAYTPGVDVSGNAVAPADLPDSGNPELSQALAQVPVKITSALLGKYGIPANAKPFGGRAELGYVTVRDGKAYLDGRQLSPSETAVLGDACRHRR